MAKEKETGFVRGSMADLDKVFDIVPFDISPEKPFQLAYLDSVIYEDYHKDATDKEPEQNYGRVVFHFKEYNGVSEFKWFLNEVFEDKPTKKGTTFTMAEQAKTQEVKLAQIYCTYRGMNAHVTDALGAGAKGEKEWLHLIEKAFNAGQDGNPIFKDSKGESRLVWLRLVYTSSGYVDFPYIGNVIDLYKKDTATMLRVGKGDLLTRPTSAKESLIPPAGSSDAAADKGFPPGFSY